MAKTGKPAASRTRKQPVAAFLVTKLPLHTTRKSTGSLHSEGLFPIVAIGESAGGLEALEQFLMRSCAGRRSGRPEKHHEKTA